MYIQYLGHSCFFFRFDNGATLVTDPYTKVGYELPNGIQADIVTVSHGHFDHNCISAINGNPVVVDRAGKYSINGVGINGILTSHDEKNGALRGANVVFTFAADGLTFCHLGDIGEPCTNALIEKIGKIDVLLIPVGGTYTIDALQAKEYVRKLAPKAAIPMHYRPKDGTIDITDEKPFLTLFKDKIRHVSPKNEVRFTREGLTDKETEIIFMERGI